MGFAVVADEVRNLAHRCSQAAKDTALLIEGSIDWSRDGKTKVDEVAGAIGAIGEESAKVKVIIDEVSVGSQEQSRGISQIGKAITQMERTTQDAAATAEESAVRRGIELAVGNPAGCCRTPDGHDRLSRFRRTPKANAHLRVLWIVRAEYFGDAVN